jgi:hypothetical protein
LQELATELIAAHSSGPTGLINYLMSGAATAEERWLRWNSLRSALDTWLAHNPLRPPPFEQPPQPDVEEGDAA